MFFSRFLSRTPILLILAIFTLLNGLFLRSQGVGIILLLLLGIGASLRIGRVFEGLLILGSGIMLFFTGAFYLASIPKLLFAGVFLLGIFLLTLLPRKTFSEQNDSPSWPYYVFTFATILTTGLFFNALSPYATELATRSIWLLLPTSILLYPLFAGLFATLASYFANVRAAILPAIFLVATGTGLALALFPLGYGFDPFIHEATIRHILTFGTIDPKPLYYIGQYALELFLVHLFALDLTTLNQFLLPVLASVALPIALSMGLKGMGEKPGLGLLALALLPFGAFIMTTPQGLGYLLSALILFLTLPGLLQKPLPVQTFTIALLALATLAVHPLAGIPITLYLLLLTLFTRFGNRALPFLLLTPFVLPLVFILQSALAGTTTSIRLSELFSGFSLGHYSFFTTHYNPFLDLLYFFGANTLPILFLVALVVLFVTRKNKTATLLRVPFLFALTLLLSSLFLRTLSFDYLALHERLDFAERLFVLIAIFLLPYLSFALSDARARLTRPLPIIISALLLATLFTANLYQSYPRHDGYTRSGGFTISALDLLAVASIEDDANDEPYLVLANQAVSATALREFGFTDRYYNDHFFYPIPTGGKLYESYLSMNEAPTAKNAKRAMDLLSVDRAYFVVNDYWWDRERIVEQAKVEADEWFAIGDENLFIFLFTREEDPLESVR